MVRPALRAALDGADSAQVGLVCAPAGFGKTLLLADWARTSTGADVAWVGLDRDDNDPKRLWASVIAAVAACPSVPADSRLHGPWLWRPAGVPEFLAELGVALARLPRPVRLILDDVHELVDPDALHGLRPSCGTGRPGCSSCWPAASTRRCRCPGCVWRAGCGSCAPRGCGSRSAEAATLLARSGVELTAGQVEVLHARTGGWAAGLRLAALALAETADRDGFLAEFSGDERSVADYLVEEIISGLPQDLRQFLRLVSISDPVPCGLAVELSGRADAGERARPARAADLAGRGHRAGGGRSTASRSCCGPTCAPT